jgi:molecular chaperone DnaK
MGGLMTTIITRNSSIPVKQSEVFSTGSDSQDTVEIHVLQGERQFAKDNKSLGIFKLKGIPSAPKGVPRINVTFQLDVNGLLAVSAREEQSGQEQSIKIEGASTLSRDEVSQMIKEAEENSSLDKAKKSIVNVTYEFDNLLTKFDNLEAKYFIQTKSSNLLTLEVLKQFKDSYLTSKIGLISKNLIDTLKYSVNVSLFEYFSKELSSSSSSGSASGSSRGPVIDITES